MLKIIATYQMLSSIIILFMHLFRGPALIIKSNDLLDVLFYLFFLFLAIFFMVTNLYFLYDKTKYKANFLKWNFLITIFQVLSLSIIGYSFDFVFGLRAMIYFLFDESMDLRLYFDFFDAQLKIFNKDSSAILIGVNIIPLFLSIVYFKNYLLYIKTGRTRI
jgi:hypothetical protein